MNQDQYNDYMKIIPATISDIAGWQEETLKQFPNIEIIKEPAELMHELKTGKCIFGVDNDGKYIRILTSIPMIIMATKNQYWEEYQIITSTKQEKKFKKRRYPFPAVGMTEQDNRDPEFSGRI